MSTSPASGSLPDAYSSFSTFLAELELLTIKTDLRFVGRNFRLDERVPAERVRSYREVAEPAPGGITDWYDDHRNYLARVLWVEQPPSGLPRRVNPDDPATCAESFSAADAFTDLSQTDPSVELVRVERAASIADAVGVTEADVLRQFAGAIADQADASAVSWTDAVLGRWSRTRDLRPAWAAFLEDCEDVLGADSKNAHWASVLRDRLGLADLDPALSGRGVSIVVFRYPARLVPTLLGIASRRALAFPTVLDGGLSEAFCPAPTESPWGRVVDLAAAVDVPYREVIHAPVRVRARHLCDVGVVEARVRRPLADARGLHLLSLQVMCGRDDFGDQTDGDLLA